MLFNATSEAGLYWPGFYKVDTTTPGKQWVQAHRERKRLEYAELKNNKQKKRSATPPLLEQKDISPLLISPPPLVEAPIIAAPPIITPTLQVIDPLDGLSKEGTKKRKKGSRRAPRGPKTLFNLFSSEKDPHVD